MNEYPNFEKRRRELQRKIREKNSGIPPIFSLFFFLLCVLALGRIFGWW